jgi:hypothetical protein
MEISVKGFAFVNHVDNSINPQIQINLIKIYEIRHHLFLSNLQYHGYIKNMGYLYDLKNYLKKYIVKQYGSWHEYYAPNKTLLRKSIYGRIDTIIEVN